MAGIKLIVLLSIVGLSPKFETNVFHDPCNDQFAFEVSHSSPGENNGGIEISFTNQNESYVLKVYRINHQIELVKTYKIDRLENGKYFIKDLAPATYLVKIEWGGTCTKTIGGIEGIQIFDELR